MVIDFGHSTPLPKSQHVIIFSQVNLNKTPIKNILHLYKNDDNNNNKLLSYVKVFFLIHNDGNDVLTVLLLSSSGYKFSFKFTNFCNENSLIFVT